MNKPQAWKPGDTVGIVSLSSGTLGEAFCRHSVDIGTRRLEEMGLKVRFSQNCLKGCAFLKEHPELRAADLKEMFLDDTVKGVICAIGGDDTYRLIPYLMEDEEFIKAVHEHPKIFTGFSDTTVNHMMLNRLGLHTFYGPNFLCDIAELGQAMLPYTEKEFARFRNIDSMAPVVSSEMWYEERKDFSEHAVGTERVRHEELKGYELLQGSPVFEGRLLGGCLESIYNMIAGGRYDDEKDICRNYHIVPELKEWEDAILFIETCEECPEPALFEKELDALKESGIFKAINGMIVGKPQNEIYYEEYKEILQRVTGDKKVPILYNVNFGHAYPRCVLPYGIKVRVDYPNKNIRYLETILR